MYYNDDPYYVTPEQEAQMEERAQEHLADLIKYAEETKKAGFSFEVKGGDLDMVLRALKGLHRPPLRTTAEP